MNSPINKESLRRLAELSRLTFTPEEEEKLLHDLQNILNYVQELDAVPTEKVMPMTGGTNLKNSFRSDEERADTNLGQGRDAFPKTDNGFLKVPPVFTNE